MRDPAETMQQAPIDPIVSQISRRPSKRLPRGLERALWFGCVLAVPVIRYHNARLAGALQQHRPMALVFGELSRVTTSLRAAHPA